MNNSNDQISKPPLVGVGARIWIFLLVAPFFTGDALKCFLDYGKPFVGIVLVLLAVSMFGWFLAGWMSELNSRKK